MRLSLIEGKLCFTRSERFVVFKAGNARRKKNGEEANHAFGEGEDGDDVGSHLCFVFIYR